jgi:hypothetical protein
VARNWGARVAAGRITRVRAADDVLQQRAIGDRARKRATWSSDDANAIKPKRETRP